MRERIQFLPDTDQAIGVTVDYDGGTFVLNRAEDPSTEIARTADAVDAAKTIAWTLLEYARDRPDGERTDFSYLAEDMLIHVDDYAALLEDAAQRQTAGSL